jgi:dTDP-4-dehydrorhamnose reductase
MIDKILVTGCNGQLGSEIKKLSLEKNLRKIFFTDFEDLDITNKILVEQFIFKNNINTIINTAAYTNVEKAEVEIEKVNEVNVEGVENLVKVSEKYNCRLIHYSTDYVYEGLNKSPIAEDFKINPLNNYGISKRKGEIFIENSSCESIVIRTSWLYSVYGNNFVKTIINRAKNERIINIVNDQFGCPTNARDLAKDTLNILNSKIRLDSSGKIFNYSNLGLTNWSDFAKKIIKLLNLKCEINEVSTASLKSNVTRPKYSVTDKSKIINSFNLKIPNWEDTLKVYLTNLQL